MSWFDDSDKGDALDLLAEWLRTHDNPSERLKEKTGAFLALKDWDGFEFVYSLEDDEWEEWIDTKDAK